MRSTRPLFFSILLAGLTAVDVGCSSQERVTDVGGAMVIRLERISLGLFSSFVAETVVPKRNPPDAEQIRVVVTLRGGEFERMTIIADGESFSYPRLAFQKDRAWFPLSDLARMEKAGSIAIQFGGSVVPLDNHDAMLFRRFAASAVAWYDSASQAK